MFLKLYLHFIYIIHFNLFIYFIFIFLFIYYIFNIVAMIVDSGITPPEF